MASVFLYHVIGDLTVGKSELVEFLETETVGASIKAIGESMEGGIPVWIKPKSPKIENVGKPRQQRFVWILNSLDIMAFLARGECLDDHEKAMKTMVSQVVVPNNSLLKEVDPATRAGKIRKAHAGSRGLKILGLPKHPSCEFNIFM